jgi:hypothetical protein
VKDCLRSYQPASGKVTARVAVSSHARPAGGSVRRTDQVRPLPTLPWLPAAEPDPAARINPEALPLDHVRSWLDLGYAVNVLMLQSA